VDVARNPLLRLGGPRRRLIYGGVDPRSGDLCGEIGRVGIVFFRDQSADLSRLA